MAEAYELAELQKSHESESHEHAYERSVRSIESVSQDEDARRLRLHILLLEDENDDLHEQLSQDDDQIDALEHGLEGMQERINEAEQELRSTHAGLRAKAREVEAAKAELGSLNTVSANSTKVLMEKLALSNELANLKPELEHLRSQAVTHQAMLSEKLNLQRQLSAVQVELETERRTTHRLLEKEEKVNARESKMESQLESLRKDLAKEKRDRDRLEKESRKDNSDRESRREVLESKLEAMRDKLRSTKEKLRETQTQLQESQSATAAALKDAKARSREAPVKNARKRAAPDTDSYAAIGTPDGLAGTAMGRAVKRTKRSSTLPGDKSTFSMTPFLSRTSMAPESPKGESGGTLAEPEKSPGATNHQAISERAVSSPTAQKSETQEPSDAGNAGGAVKVFGGSKPAKRNARNIRKSAAPTLEKVSEEGNEENDPPPDALASDAPKHQTHTEKPKVSLRAISEEPEARKKKIKLLSGGPGKTLFDEVEGESSKPAAKPIFGAAKSVRTLGRGGLGGLRGGVGRGLAGDAGSFGAFSPLKKDRKSVTVG